MTAGSAPPGLLLNAATGELSGTPTTPGSYTFDVRVQDSNAVTQFATKAFSLTIDPPQLLITTASPLPSGSVNNSYTQSLAATGGTPPYS